MIYSAYYPLIIEFFESDRNVCDFAYKIIPKMYIWNYIIYHFSFKWLFYEVQGTFTIKHSI